MAIIRQRELVKMQKEDLIKRKKELELELAKERSSAAIGGTVKNPGRLSEIRKTLARIKSLKK